MHVLSFRKGPEKSDTEYTVPRIESVGCVSEMKRGRIISRIDQLSIGHRNNIRKPAKRGRKIRCKLKSLLRAFMLFQNPEGGNAGIGICIFMGNCKKRFCIKLITARKACYKRLKETKVEQVYT